MATVCTAAVWVNVATTPVSPIHVRTAAHVRSKRLRCSTALAAKDSGVRSHQIPYFSSFFVCVLVVYVYYMTCISYFYVLV